VKEVEIYVGFEFVNYGKTSFGMAKAVIQGYDLA
jgi:hypothetical protein